MKTATFKSNGMVKVESALPNPVYRGVFESNSFDAKRLDLFYKTVMAALAENPTTGNHPTKNFEVGMYQTIRTSKLNLTIEKVKGQRLSVTLQNATGQVLYTEMVGKNSTK